MTQSSTRKDGILNQKAPLLGRAGGTGKKSRSIIRPLKLCLCKIFHHQEFIFQENVKEHLAMLLFYK